MEKQTLNKNIPLSYSKRDTIYQTKKAWFPFIILIIVKKQREIHI